MSTAERIEILPEYRALFASLHSLVSPRIDASRDRGLTIGIAGALIVEGTYVLTLEDLDVGIFLDATHVDTRERRRARNRDIDAPIIDRVLAIEHRIIAPQASRAQIVIDREFRIRDGGHRARRRAR